MKNIIRLICLFAISPFLLISQTPTASFATWKDNRTAAYSIIHDDYSSWVTGIYQYADPIATARGVKLAFGAITSGCGATEWANANTMIGHGHECINHSHNHKCGGSASNCSGQLTYSPADFSVELDQSTNLIQTNTGRRPRFFIHPYDAVVSGDVPSTTIINYLTSIGYIGTRAGSQETVNASNFTNYMYLNFYVYDGTQSLTTLNNVVNNTITAGGYALREFHGVADGSWAAMTLANYTSHLDFVKTKIDNGTLWSATPTQAISYMKQRNAFQPVASYVAATGNINVTFNTLQILSSNDLAVLNSNMSASVTLNVNVGTLPQSFDVYQNNVLIPSIRNGSVVTFNVYPHQGSVELRCASGCVPSTTPNNILNFAAVASNGSVTLNWTNPTSNFDDVLIVAQPATSITATPNTSTTYVPDPNYLGTGTVFGTNGGKVVYFSKGTTVTVTGLTNGVLYYFKAFSRFSLQYSSGVEVNAMPSAPNLPINVSNLAATPASTTIALSWTNPSVSNMSEIMVVASLTPFTTLLPTGDGTAYTANANFTGAGTAFDGGKVVYKGTGISMTITNLTSNVLYYYKVFTRLGTAWSSGVGGSSTTTTAPLPINVTNLLAIPASTTIALSWTNPPAANMTQIMVVASLTPFTTLSPTGDGTAYTANANFTGAGTAFDGGKVVYKGTGASMTITNLTGTTNYYYKVFTRLGTVWSTGVVGSTTTTVANLPMNVSNLTSTVTTNTMTLAWTRPPTTNYTQFMIVVSTSPFTSLLPTGNGGAYTANANFSGAGTAFDGGKVVYKGTGTTMTVTGLAEGTTYYYKVFTRLTTAWSNGVTGSNKTATTVTTCANGRLTRALWTGLTLSTYTINDLKNNTNYPNTPTSTDEITTTFESTDRSDAYGERLSGYIIPSVSGNHTFTVTGDDDVELYLSTDANAANKVKIAGFTGYTSATQYTKYAGQKSAAINLVAGTAYYVEALHIGTTGTNFMAVHWQTPTISTITKIGSNNISTQPCSVAGNSDARMVNNQTGNAVETAPLSTMDADATVTNPNEPKSQQLNTSYKMFPNPANQFVDIDLTAANGQWVDITVLSMIGQILKKESVQSSLSVHRMNLDDLSNGQYLVRIQTKNQMTTVQKLTIMRK